LIVVISIMPAGSLPNESSCFTANILSSRIFFCSSLHPFCSTQDFTVVAILAMLAPKMAMSATQCGVTLDNDSRLKSLNSDRYCNRRYSYDYFIT
uniref:Secreted protein n=1 Tax=Haemonchus placei TaxID=6290 RepID=A0A158QL73_HAEPC